MKLRAFIFGIFFLITTCVFAQEATSTQEPVRISPTEAEQHLLKRISPPYPPLAETSRIQGIVSLEVTISAAGTTTVKLISGYPLLIASTIEAVKQWQYKPFEKDGKPITVKTNVVLEIPEIVKKSDIKQEDEFLSTYWPAKSEGESSLKNHDYDAAVKSLLIARTAAEQRGDSKWLEVARIDSELSSAENGRKNFLEAERRGESALAIYEKRKGKNDPETASAMEILAQAYIGRNKSVDAEALLLQAVKTYKNHLGDTWPPDAASMYGSHVAAAAFSLVTTAHALQHPKVAQEHCKNVLANASWLGKEQAEYVTRKCNEILTGKP